LAVLRLPTKNLRTSAGLSKFLLDELGWRRKEILYFRTLVDSGKARDTFARGAIAILYAHWEGFIKTSASAYIEHVRQQNRKLAELTSNFVALGARKFAESAAQGARWEFQVRFCEFVRTCDSRVSQWPKGFTVGTGANLNVARFRDIVALVGIQYRAEFQTAEKPVLERLLELRNQIAHGDSQFVDLDEYHQLQETIDALLIIFCNELDNAAAMELYRVAVSAPSPGTISGDT
jgi:hypothetical protein